MRARARRQQGKPAGGQQPPCTAYREAHVPELEGVVPRYQRPRPRLVLQRRVLAQQVEPVGGQGAGGAANTLQVSSRRSAAAPRMLHASEGSAGQHACPGGQGKRWRGRLGAPGRPEGVAGQGQRWSMRAHSQAHNNLLTCFPCQASPAGSCDSLRFRGQWGQPRGPAKLSQTRAMRAMARPPPRPHPRPTAAAAHMCRRS